MASDEARLGRSRAERRAALAAGVAVSLLVAVLGARSLSASPETGGSRHNLSIAYNLWKHGVASDSGRDRADVQPDCRREPLYPMLLAGVLALSADPERTTRACLAGPRPACHALVRRLKLVNVALFAAICACTLWAGRLLLGGGLAPYLACALMALDGAHWRVLDRMKSEPLATLLVLLTCAFLHRLVTRPGRARALAAGLALGLLMLAKAVFFYAGPALLLAAALPAGGARRRPWAPVAGALVVAYLVAGVWVARNVADGFGVRVSQDREVLAIRAEHTTMSWREWRASWLYFAGEGSARARALLVRTFQVEDWALLDERNPDGYYERAKKNRGAVAARTGLERPSEMQVYEAAKGVILENWPMQIALTGPFAIRGIYVGQSTLPWRPLREALRLTANLLVPALFLFAALLARRRDVASLWFFVLPLYGYAFHAFITQNIDRFSWPFLPAGAIALAALLATGLRRARGAMVSA